MYRYFSHFNKQAFCKSNLYENNIYITAFQSEIKQSNDGNWIFSDIDQGMVSPSKAPMGHQRHVTDMGRALSSLAPMAEQRHITMSSHLTPSPGPLSTQDIEIQRPPTHSGLSRLSGATGFSELKDLKSRESSFDSFALPQQITSPRKPVPETVQSKSSAKIPKIKVDQASVKRKTQKKIPRKSPEGSEGGRLSPFVPIKDDLDHDDPREGSPLPMQILTPRNEDDLRAEAKKKARRETKGGRKAGTAKDLIDSDSDLRKVYRRNTPSPNPLYRPTTDLSHDVEDIDV